jgi:hypothetical protein
VSVCDIIWIPIIFELDQIYRGQEAGDAVIVRDIADKNIKTANRFMYMVEILVGS